MSRDGLLPPAFRAVHPIYRTPHVTTIVTGIVVAIGATLLDDDETYDLTNIGTLFAFLVVCLASSPCACATRIGRGPSACRSSGWSRRSAPCPACS